MSRLLRDQTSRCTASALPPPLGALGHRGPVPPCRSHFLAFRADREPLPTSGFGPARPSDSLRPAPCSPRGRTGGGLGLAAASQTAGREKATAAAEPPEANLDSEGRRKGNRMPSRAPARGSPPNATTCLGPRRASVSGFLLPRCGRKGRSREGGRRRAGSLGAHQPLGLTPPLPPPQHPGSGGPLPISGALGLHFTDGQTWG